MAALFQWLCLISAFVALVAGAASLTQATMGAGLIAAEDELEQAEQSGLLRTGLHDGQARRARRRRMRHV